MVASDGTEAVIAYAQHPDEISLVLTDMMMPFMDGLATVKALRKINPDVKVIAASGLSTSDKVAEAAKTGMTKFLAKPFTAEKLLETVSETLKEDSLT